MREVLRRAVLAVGLLAGLWMAVWPAPQLFRVYPIDWDHARESKERRAADAKRIIGGMVGEKMVEDLDLYPGTRASRENFIAEETRDRVTTVQGPEWEGFFNAVADTSLGQPPSRSWQARLAKSPYIGSLYFRTDEPPLSSIAANFKGSSSSGYVRVNGQQRQEHLFVALHGKDEIVRHATSALAFPSRHIGIYVLLAAFLFYALLPWPRPPAEGLYYSRARAAVLPDLMGAIFAGMFFVIPILVPADFAGDSPFDPGWNIMTGIFWLLTLLMLSMLAVAAWYMARRLGLTPEGFTYDGLTVHYSRRWEEIERVEEFERPAIPPWLRKALFIVALLNWRALGPALIFGGKEAGFRIVFKDGTALSFMLKTLVGADAFIGRVRDHAVPIAPTVYAALGRNPDAPSLPRQFPNVSKGIGRLVLFVIILAALVSLAYVTMPPGAPQVQPASLRPQPFALPEEEPVTITWETLAKENDILAQMEQERPKLEELAARMKTASPDERKAIQSEFDRIMTRFNDLQQEFDAARKPPAAEKVVK